MTTPIRVLFIAPHPVEGPSTRFRIIQYMEYLEANGVSCTLRPFFTSADARVIYLSDSTAQKVLVTLRAAVRRLGDVLRARNFDLVYILREAFPFGPPLVERALHRRAGRMLYDFDDAIHVPSSAYRNHLDRLRDWSKAAECIRAADLVAPGSAWLAELARRSGADSSKISVLPTVVDTAEFVPRAPARTADTAVVGWIGTPRNTSYLRSLAPVLSQVSDAHPDARFVFVGAEPFACHGAPVSFREWQLDREVADLHSFDIGIMPLADDETGRGKCGFKLIEYMAVGIPTVASPVGANLDIVADGVTGRLASTAAEWFQALSELIGNAELRARMGRAGRARAEEHFCARVVAPRLLAAIRRAVDAPSPCQGPSGCQGSGAQDPAWEWGRE